MFDPQQTSALTQNPSNHLAESDTSLLSECCEFAFLDLRGEVSDVNFVDAVEQVTGIKPPASPNTYTEHQRRALFWMGPDQWLLSVPRSDLQQIETELSAQRETVTLVVTDVSSGYTLLALSGKQCDELMRSATPFDVATLKSDVCAQTILAKAHVMLWKPQTSEYRVLVRRSFANYLSHWFISAGVNFNRDINGS